MPMHRIVYFFLPGIPRFVLVYYVRSSHCIIIITIEDYFYHLSLVST
jgi:hypothetical protein